MSYYTIKPFFFRSFQIYISTFDIYKMRHCQKLNRSIHFSYSSLSYQLYFCAFSIEMTSHISLFFAGKQIQACLHFQQTLSIDERLPSSLQVRTSTLAGSGFPMISSISRGKTQLFNDDVNGKSSDSFTHKDCTFHCERMCKMYC